MKSIIIVVYEDKGENEPWLLKNCISSLKRCEPKCHICIVDNDAEKRMQGMGEVLYIKLKSRANTYAAINLAIKHVKPLYERVIIVDQGMELKTPFLTPQITPIMGCTIYDPCGNLLNEDTRYQIGAFHSLLLKDVSLYDHTKQVPDVDLCLKALERGLTHTKNIRVVALKHNREPRRDYTYPNYNWEKINKTLGLPETPGFLTLPF